jgi:hypothetical protein
LVSGVSVQPSRRPKKRPVKSRERNYIFVINDEVSYEVSGKVDATTYPNPRRRNTRNLTPKKRNKKGIKVKGHDMRIFITLPPLYDEAF